jgi:hypothetical protein
MVIRVTRLVVAAIYDGARSHRPPDRPVLRTGKDRAPLRQRFATEVPTGRRRSAVRAEGVGRNACGRPAAGYGESVGKERELFPVGWDYAATQERTAVALPLRADEPNREPAPAHRSNGRIALGSALPSSHAASRRARERKRRRRDAKTPKGGRSLLPEKGATPVEMEALSEPPAIDAASPVPGRTK